MVVVKSFFTVLFIGVILLVMPTSCNTSETAGPVLSTPSQVLTKSSLIGQYSAEQLRSRYTGISALFRVFIRYGIRVYRLEYRTG